MVSIPCTSRTVEYTKTRITGRNFPDLLEATIDELASGLDMNEFTSVDLVKVRKYLALI